MNKKKQSQQKPERPITAQDYFGPRSTLRVLLLVLLVFGVVYSLYTVWQVRQWTKKERIEVIRDTERNLTGLSQWIIRASVGTGTDYLQILKKFIADKPYIQQVSFRYRNNQTFTTSNNFIFNMPGVVDRILRIQDEKVGLKVVNGIIDFGNLSVDLNGEYIKYRIWVRWIEVTRVVLPLLLIVGLVFWFSLRRNWNALRAIAVCANQIRQGNMTARLAESGSNERLAAVRAVNQLATMVDSQAYEISHSQQSIQSELEKRKDVEARKENAELANMSKSQYLSNISEELRPPITSILSLSEMMKRPEFQNQERHFLDMVHASAIQMQDFIDGVIDIAQIETNNLTIKKSIFTFRDMMRMVKSSIEPVFSKRNKVLEVVTDNDIPQYVIADERRVRQVITSLLCEILSATDKDKISIKTNIVKTDVVSVTIQFMLYAESINPVNGGVPDTRQEHDQSEAESICNIYGKSGVGLSITKKLIAAMDGDLQENAIRREQNSYQFSLRLDRPSQAQLGEYDKIQKARGARANKTLRVLLAESHLINRYVFELVFFHKGYVTIKAENGEEALRRMNEDKIDIAILDMQLPVLDGLSVVREWRKGESEDSYLPIILMTNDARTETIDSCLELADYVEAKPVSPYQLIEDIETWLASPHEPKRPGAIRRQALETDDLIDTDFIRNLKERGETDEIRGLVNNFYHVFEDEMKNLKLALEEGDINAYREISQRIKGGTGTIGAKALNRHFTRFQSLESGYVLKNRDELLDSIDHIYQQTRNAYRESIGTTHTFDID